MAIEIKLTTDDLLEYDEMWDETRNARYTIVKFLGLEVERIYEDEWGYHPPKVNRAEHDERVERIIKKLWEMGAS